MDGIVMQKFFCAIEPVVCAGYNMGEILLHNMSRGGFV